jgi:hypothetical protein
LMKKCVQPRTDHQTLWQALAGQSNFKQDSRHECLLTKAQCETQEEILSGCLVFFADSITRCNCVEPCKLTSWD